MTSSTHQVAEPNKDKRIPLVEARAEWLRVVVFVAVALAGVVVVWSLLKGADRDLRNFTAMAVYLTPLPLTS